MKTPVGTPDPRREKPWLAEALRALTLEARPPTPSDAPATSSFPMTRAARAALNLNRRKGVNQ